MNMKRRLFAALLAMVMLITCGTTLAEDTDTSDVPDDVPTEMADGETPPDLPDGEQGGMGEAPNGEMGEAPDGEMGEAPDGGGMGGGESSYTLTGVLTADGETVEYDGDEDGSELTSTTSDENVVLALNSANLSISNVTLNKSGDTEDSDATDFYAVNAVVAATDGSTVEVSDVVIESAAKGANCLFATGEGSILYAQNVTIHSTSNNSRGLDATYEGTVVADSLDISTEGDHCGAVATDRGNGYISIANSTLSTQGQGSPLLYSTGTIEAINVTGEATGAQIVGMEGLNTVRIISCDLTGSGEKASEPIANGVIIYQSMSGDATEGEALFEASDSTLTSYIENGAMFYVTNTQAEIVLQNTVLNFDSDTNTLLTAAGNDDNGWGTSGENGGEVKFTAIGETLAGNVLCDGISVVEMYLVDGTTLTGAALHDDTYEGDGGISIYLSADSAWTVTEDSVLISLTMPEGAAIQDADGNSVSIIGSDGTVYVEGDSDITVTVDTFSTEDVSSEAGSISDTEVDRSYFDA